MTVGFRHMELGVMDTPVLVFGGPYSNAQALAALIRAAQAQGIASAQMICTGDVVAYCGAPARTVAQMRALGCAVVAGNCEIQLGNGAPDCGCGFADGSACDLLSLGWYGFASGVLSQADKVWMAGLPAVLSFRHYGARYAVIHGGMTDVARFIWPSSDLGVFAQEWAAVEQVVGSVDHIIAGHAGVPFVKLTPQGRWINAGVIGMPPHDGQQETRFAVLEQGEIRIERLRYDVQGAADDMVQAGLPQGYCDGLISGYWPSEDVLPAGLRVPSLARG